MLRKYRVFIVWQDHYRTYRMRPLDAALWSQLTAWRLTTSQFSTTDFKCKGKAHSVTCHEGPEWSRGIAPLFSLSARLIIRGQLDALAALTPGKETQYPLYMRLVGPQGRSGHVQKISPPPRFDLRTVQPVANRYADCTVSARKDKIESKWTWERRSNDCKVLQMTMAGYCVFKLAVWVCIINIYIYVIHIN